MASVRRVFSIREAVDPRIDPLLKKIKDEVDRLAKSLTDAANEIVGGDADTQESWEYELRDMEDFAESVGMEDVMKAFDDLVEAVLQPPSASKKKLRKL